MLLASPDWLVVPGRRLGHVSVNAAAKTTFSRLGTPQYGDAAMQRSWSTWIGTAGGRLDVFIVNDRAGTATERRTVHVVRATSSRFHLANGLHPGSATKSLRRAYPAAKRTGEYRTASGRVAFWDDVRKGLAWEAAPNGRVLALIVHPSGEALSGSTGPYVSTPLHKD